MFSLSVFLLFGWNFLVHNGFEFGLSTATDDRLCRRPADLTLVCFSFTAGSAFSSLDSGTSVIVVGRLCEWTRKLFCWVCGSSLGFSFCFVFDVIVWASNSLWILTEVGPAWTWTSVDTRGLLSYLISFFRSKNKSRISVTKVNQFYVKMSRSPSMKYFSWSFVTFRYPM